MLKKTYFALALLLLSASVSAQNIQLHFDPRHALHSDDFAKNYFTTTFEFLNIDKRGSTFMFVDLDFNQSQGNIGLAYMEIARDQKIANLPFKAHIEYNGGIGKGFSIPNSYLVGASYNKFVGGVFLTTYLAYKYNAFARVSNDIQWTATWVTHLFENKISLSGFLDVWTENKDRTGATHTKDKKIVILTEPQIWYNINSNLSIGTEIEMSSNFLVDSYYKDKAFINPTIAAKWNF